MVFGIVLCVHTPEQPHTLTQDDLETIHIGMRFEDIAREIGGGDWISDAEAFTVRYDVEGDMQLVLVFEDGIHLSGAILSHPDGETTTTGTAPALGSVGQ
jgi:hypothetical protein